MLRQLARCRVAGQRRSARAQPKTILRLRPHNANNEPLHQQRAFSTAKPDNAAAAAAIAEALQKALAGAAPGGANIPFPADLPLGKM